MLRVLGVLAILLVAYYLWYWFRGRRGLDQWPSPHGRHYREWLKAPLGAGDYYPWLAARMGGREPWRTWAEWDRSTEHDEPA